MTTHPGTTAAAYLDEAMKAIALAKQALLGGADAALFLSTPALAEAEASGDNPYGSSVPLASLRDREHYDAGSAAEVAEGVDRECTCQVPGAHDPDCAVYGPPAEPCAAITSEGRMVYACILTNGHQGQHESHGAAPFTWSYEPGFCPAQWGEPPETMLCSLASGHDGNHATAEGIEWGGRWETAEPHGGAR